ncbi:KAP family P-loop NTPase fold protein [Enhygromyxa salina]|uniref:KAP family P-loop domain protein n=1 Tax=Enhygromyxa salina TaxID=215803 RepID=A0A2S9XL83_9BACT|nr:P-loop NTPase fold protein [Enhygromyxa salina]PRP93500.1 KAP family P-loop domain protein [Enhygromyxa salina]
MATVSKTGFPDLPIDPLRGEAIDNRDLLGLDQHAAALAGFIEMCSMPMTIGIQGDWGSGKTSLMNLVRAKLGNGKALNVWFNTWQYAQFGNEEQLASSMLVNLMQKIKLQGKASKKVWHNASRFIRAVVQASELRKGGFTLQGQSLVDALEGRGEVDDAGLFEQMKADFAEVISDILLQGREKGSVERVVIYIDDLDRLAPSKAVELLEAVKNLIDVEGCVFVLAIDYDVVIRGLRQRKGYDTGEFRESEGKNFFDKIIQVPYRMPVERYTTHVFLQSHFERVYGELSPAASAFFEKSATELIQLSVGNNPRSLKRALNIHSLFSHLMRIGRDDVADAERLVTLVFACMQVSLPQMYSLLAKQDVPFRVLVTLGDPGIYGLLGQSDESDAFEHVATRLGDRLRRLQRHVDDDDDDEYGTGEIQALATDLRRFTAATDTGMHKRMQRLALVALQAVDLNGDGVYSPQEFEILRTALSVTSSTSVEAESSKDVEASPARGRRNVGFKELAETMSSFAERPDLVFWDPVAEEFDQDIRRTPDYDNEISRLRVIVDGVSVPLKEETLRVLQMLEERGFRELTTREHSQRINPSSYWVVDGDDEERTVAMLRDEWKSSTNGPDTRSDSGRARYDARVLQYLRSRGGEFVPAREVQEHVGGNKPQVRRALNRLIESGEATYTGRARGTRYACT